jgi:hypothetical protein
MSRVKTLCMVLFTVLVAAAFTTTSAFAELPDVHVEPGGFYPVASEGAIGTGSTVVGRLETELGEKLTFGTALIRMTLLELSALGPIEFEFTGSKEKAGNECHSPARSQGVVTFTGEYHVVYTGLTTLTAGMLLLFMEQTVACNKEKLKIKIKPPALVKLTGAAGT